MKIVKNPRKDRINKDEPKAEPLDKIPACPGRFKERSQKMLWKRTCELLQKLKVLAEADLMAVEELVYHKYMSDRAEEMVKEHGEVLELTNKTGEAYLAENPWINIKIKSSDRFVKLCTQFGLTPSSRSSIKAPSSSKKSGVKSLAKSKSA